MIYSNDLYTSVTGADVQIQKIAEKYQILKTDRLLAINGTTFCYPINLCNRLPNFNWVEKHLDDKSPQILYIR